MRFTDTKGGRTLITHGYAVDWITLTTFDKEEFESLRDFIRSDTNLVLLNEYKIMQYEGQGGQGIFFGKAIQRGQHHYMVQGRGGEAHQVYLSYLKSGTKLKCTRIDIQLTLDRSEFHSSLQEMRDVLRNKDLKWNQRGKKPSIDLEDRQHDLSTLYVGSRKTKNGAFIRVYDKNAGGMELRRFEVEFKGTAAHAIVEHLETKSVTLSAMIYGQLSKFPDAGQMLLKPYLDFGDKEGVKITVVRDDDPAERRFMWFKFDVAPTLEKMAHTDLAGELFLEMMHVMLKIMIHNPHIHADAYRLRHANEKAQILLDILEEQRRIIDTTTEVIDAQMGFEDILPEDDIRWASGVKLGDDSGHRDRDFDKQYHQWKKKEDIKKEIEGRFKKQEEARAEWAKKIDWARRSRIARGVEPADDVDEEQEEKEDGQQTEE